MFCSGGLCIDLRDLGIAGLCLAGEIWQLQVPLSHQSGPRPFVASPPPSRPDSTTQVEVNLYAYNLAWVDLRLRVSDTAKLGSVRVASCSRPRSNLRFLAASATSVVMGLQGHDNRKENISKSSST